MLAILHDSFDTVRRCLVLLPLWYRKINLQEAFPCLPRPALLKHLKERPDALMLRQNVGSKMSVGRPLRHCWYVGHFLEHFRRHSTWPQDIWDGGDFVFLGDRCTCPRHSLQWAVRHLEGLIPAPQRLAPLSREGQRLGRRVAQQQLQRVRP